MLQRMLLSRYGACLFDIPNLTVSKAATQAGISPVSLIKEPEAAALYTIRRLDANLDPTDVIVICDAGGGTVDLVSYEIEATYPTLQLKEIVPGTGKFCHDDAPIF